MASPKVEVIFLYKLGSFESLAYALDVFLPSFRSFILPSNSDQRILFSRLSGHETFHTTPFQIFSTKNEKKICKSGAARIYIVIGMLYTG